jgi:hypothetical protein
MTPAQFYGQAGPLVEQLLTMARDWRDAEPANPDAVKAYGEFMWLAIRTDLRRIRMAQGAHAVRSNTAALPVGSAHPGPPSTCTPTRLSGAPTP